MTAQPNILLITDDEHRWDFFRGGDDGAYPALRTPNLDRLRARGTELTHGYSNCPVCMPTRFTWMHGLYASQGAARLVNNAHDWPMHLPTMPQALQRAGYHTALVGKLHAHAGLYHCDLREREAQVHRWGFDDVTEVSGKMLAYWFYCRWCEHLDRKGLYDGYRQSVVNRPDFSGKNGPALPGDLSPDDAIDGFIGSAAARWLSDYDGPKPFYLHASLCGPHFPFDPPREYAARYRGADMPTPLGVDDLEQADEARDRRALYCAMIEHVDEQVGRILDALEQRGLAENTLVLFTTDHGEMLGDHGQWGKSQPNDASVRTPVIARWPGRITAGGRSDAMVEAVDLPATILDAAGLGPDPTESLVSSPGRSYLPCLLGEQTEHRPWVYSECGLGAKAWRMCRDRRWKYIQRGDGSCHLLDMEHDPDERHDLSADPQHLPRLATMQGRLIQSMMRAMTPDAQAESPTVQWPRPGDAIPRVVRRPALTSATGRTPAQPAPQPVS